ncbi:thiopeptide-type bacteriocin biosynthesis protein [Streptomyces sp. UNOC14_S4]|uniref:thiopeptide-type bacteriocin biosynthesis protein n=1 Tax=Streptomyces sp. UNOC14_S4 TaxID=2872340 RepID=UPI001E51579E|nr:thiopeptide-type bacteriocin biosynthesis protein [Streptomyces sp. UNOC14_S4]MCC3767572.1 thiopeptide-type bacteriocin biosynthesis protein [Streptomyces sp. UNOC14_S4]
MTTGPETLWLQTHIKFTDPQVAEQLAVCRLRPRLAVAEHLVGWHFIRKGQWWRLRYHQDPRATKEADSILAQVPSIQWQHDIIYEPETHAFGGPEAMDIAHHLFHDDSCQVLDHLARTRHQRDSRLEMSLLLLTALMRGAAQDWYEQGDIWAKITVDRPATPNEASRLDSAKNMLKPFLMVDTGPDTALVTTGRLSDAAIWLAAFTTAGRRLQRTAQSGQLARGLRAVLAHHALFHFNRLGIPHSTQALLALGAKEIIFEGR